jgi:hypothetical protein
MRFLFLTDTAYGSIINILTDINLSNSLEGF